jgi:hypothetical protein
MTNRQPKGTPVGGQFAEGRKPSGGDLDAHQPPTTYREVRNAYENAVTKLVSPDNSLDEVDYDHMIYAAREFFDQQPLTTVGSPDAIQSMAQRFVDEHYGSETSPEPSHSKDLRASLEAQREESERLYESALSGDDDDVTDADYWNGRMSGFSEAIALLGETGWTAPPSYPKDEDPLIVVHVTVNRTNGEVNVTTEGQLSGADGFEYAFDQMTEVAKDVVARNPDEFITNPPPRRVTFKSEVTPVSDSQGYELSFIFGHDAETATFLYDDGEFVYLRLHDGRVVHVDPIDVDVSPSVF